RQCPPCADKARRLRHPEIFGTVALAATVKAASRTRRKRSTRVVTTLRISLSPRVSDRTVGRTAGLPGSPTTKPTDVPPYRPCSKPPASAWTKPTAVRQPRPATTAGPDTPGCPSTGTTCPPTSKSSPRPSPSDNAGEPSTSKPRNAPDP